MDRPIRSSQSFKKISGSPWLILAVLSCVGLITTFADTMILPAIPDFITDLNISYSTSSWILASFLITGAVMTPVAGKPQSGPEPCEKAGSVAHFFPQTTREH